MKTPRAAPSAACSIAAAFATITAFAAGPAAAADEGDFCGRPKGEPAALLESIPKADGMKKVHDGPDYLAFQDPVSEAVFTFTRPAAGAAHPAAVCRKPVKDGDTIRLQMVILCRGAIDACQRLESDFKLLNARMEAHIRNQAGAAEPR